MQHNHRNGSLQIGKEKPQLQNLSKTRPETKPKKLNEHDEPKTKCCHERNENSEIQYFQAPTSETYIKKTFPSKDAKFRSSDVVGGTFLIF